MKKGRKPKKKEPQEQPKPLFGPDFFTQFSTKEALAYWLAMPTLHKDPKMQKDLAKIMGVSEERLCQIKKEEGFSDLVTTYRKEYFKQFTSNVLAACLKQAEAGDPRSQKLYLQYVEDFKETTRSESHKTERQEFVFMLGGPEEFKKLQEAIQKQRLLEAKNKGYIDYEKIDDNEEISNNEGS